MSDAPRRITAVKRVDLAELAEGYDKTCYALVTPATYQEHIDLTNENLSEKTQQEQVDFQYNVIRKHFVSGKVVGLNDSRDFELMEMEVDDCFASPAIADQIYATIQGFDLDPKALREAVAQAASQPNDDASTEKPSSEDPTASQEQSDQS